MAQLSFTFREAKSLMEAEAACERSTGAELDVAIRIVGLFNRIDSQISGRIPVDETLLTYLRESLGVWAKMDY